MVVLETEENPVIVLHLLTIIGTYLFAASSIITFEIISNSPTSQLQQEHVLQRIEFCQNNWNSERVLSKQFLAC